MKREPIVIKIIVTLAVVVGLIGVMEWLARREFRRVACSLRQRQGE